MLDSLLTLNADLKAKGQLPPPFYVQKNVRWILQVEGGDPTFIETEDVMDVTDRARSGRAYRPRLIDTAEYMFGVAPTKKAESAATKHENYRDLVARVDIDHPAWAVYQSLQEEDAWDVPEKMARQDVVIVEVDGVRLHELGAVQDWWASFMGSSPDQDLTEQGACALCGETAYISEVHTQIRSFQNALSSYNEDAFESYDKSGSANAWMCLSCEQRVNGTLSWLFDDEGHRYNFVDTRWVWWTETVSDPFSLDLLSGDENKVRDILRAYYDGTLSENETPIWIMGVEKNQGRLIVRHFERDTVGALQKKLAQYFDAMALYEARRDENRVYGAIPLAIAVVEKGENTSIADIPPWVEDGLARTALTGRPLPYAILNSTLNRLQARGWTGPRAALLKLYLNTRSHDMSKSLDKEHESTAYQLGRLMSILENVQYAALGDTNASIVDRFYKSASTTPRSVFGTLMGKAQAHLSTIRKSSPGRHVHLQREIAEVMGHMDTFPATLSPEEQAIFALGYYHQRQEHFSRIRDAKEAKEGAEPEMPDAE